MKGEFKMKFISLIFTAAFVVINCIPSGFSFDAEQSVLNNSISCGAINGLLLGAFSLIDKV